MRNEYRKNSKKWYQKKNFWISLGVGLIVASGINSFKESTKIDSNDKTATEITTKDSKKQSSTETTSVTKAPSKKVAKAEPKKPSVPTEYISALSKAGTYSDSMYMSKKGIYEQLTSEYGEKFSPAAAQYAIDHVSADWNKNALKKAKTYQEDMAMSPEGIRDQLTSDYGEQFTPEEANYAVSHLS